MWGDSLEGMSYPQEENMVPRLLRSNNANQENPNEGEVGSHSPQHPNPEDPTDQAGSPRREAGKPVNLADGAYQVTTSYLCAGFIVKKGHVSFTDCAPILWRRLEYWQKIAKGPSGP